MTALDALQDCLAAEHAAIYGYGVLGGVLGGTSATDDITRAQTAYDAHVRRRDDLRERINAFGEQPAVAEPAYAVPVRIDDVASCRRLAQQLEERAAAVYASAVAETVDALRELSARSLTDCALRADAWGARDDVLPGLDER
jgi:Domain of unknown function (DUF4439)